MASEDTTAADVVSVLLALLDIAENKDIERIILFFFEHGMIDIVFQCIELLNKEDRLPL